MSQWQSIKEIAKSVRSGQTTATQLVNQALATIDKHTEFNAIIAKLDQAALKRAKAIDERVANGEEVGRLCGVPFIAKDNFLVFGGETTAASNILKGFRAPYQSTAINRLEAEGAICVAKANLDAFGHGNSTENSDFMTTKNPHDTTRVAGGSSGGSAASVILDMVPFALGTDTGGSNRLPASFTGAVGYKPTYGLVSRSGVIAMASSTDTIGPLTRNVADAAEVLDVLAGKDELDGTTIYRDSQGYALNVPLPDIRGKKIGLVKEYLGEGVDESVKTTIKTAVEKLNQAGAEIKEVSLPSIELALACYYILVPAEISSNLSRYDGQHYGYSKSDATSLDDSYNWSRSEGFGTEAKRRIMIGTYVLSSGYYDAYYKKAQQLRAKLIQEFDKVFEDVDLLAGPVAPTTAFEVGKLANDPLQMYLLDIMTVAANLVGVPSISIPAGTTQNLPVGLQLMAKQRQDRQLLELAASIEAVI